MSIMQDLSRILVPREAISKRVSELGEEITASYKKSGVEELILICITNGSVIFAADILRELPLPLRMDCIRVSSYRNEMQPITEPEIRDHIRLDIKSHHVLLVDDIFDTGATLKKIVNVLQQLQPASLKTCVLLEKRGRRSIHYRPDYIGFQVPDEFVVGYGLDFAEYYRNLPCIGVLRPELQNPPEWQ